MLIIKVSVIKHLSLEVCIIRKYESIIDWRENCVINDLLIIISYLSLIHGLHFC